MSTVTAETWQNVAILMTCILSITALLIVCVVVRGIDGAVVTAGLTLIAGLGGFELGKRTERKESKEEG